jgi:hypothetical protein
MKAYKGFNRDMTCRGFQFEEGKTYEEKEAVLCEKGFHACENPLECFCYYAFETSVYNEVELEDVCESREADTKVAGKKITIGARLDIEGMVKAAVDYVFSKADWSKKETYATGDGGAASATDDHGAAYATGDYGVASATGDWGAASATGYQGAASATGNYSAASATSDWGVASATGYHSAASATGDQGAASATSDWGVASATGCRGAASATGDHGAASATGCRGAASATGYRGVASATGEGGVALAAGLQGKAKGAKGCVICCVERGGWNGKTYPIIAAKAAIVDGETIKADTWYTLNGGEFVEAENDREQ